MIEKLAKMFLVRQGKTLKRVIDQDFKQRYERQKVLTSLFADKDYDENEFTRLSEVGRNVILGKGVKFVMDYLLNDSDFVMLGLLYKEDKGSPRQPKDTS
tara:strand:+ start:2709 stop:3008 length:300 start_codon:yes stop_codon:yes gene_type:complete